MNKIYNGSPQHLANAAAARAAANKKTFHCEHCDKSFSSANWERHKTSCRLHPDRIKSCKQCSTLHGKDGEFCGSRCSCRYNNLRRDPEMYARQAVAVSKALKEHYKSNKRSLENFTNPGGSKSSKITIRPCAECGKSFTQRGWGRTVAIVKCCSVDCRFALGAKRANPYRCLSIPYMHNGKELRLQSKWELAVAQHLDALGIVWVRPRYISWTDDEGKARRYFADFYLPKYNVFLDPKNLWVQMSDRRKIEIVSQQINLVVGVLQEIIDFVDGLVPVTGIEPVALGL